MATHEVFNQPPPLESYNVATADVALMEGVVREGAGWAVDDIGALGARAGDPEVIAAGFAANASLPVLRNYDRYGHRVDEVDYHPAYHQLIGEAVANGLHASPWAEARRGAHVARAAKFSVWTQVEAGHGCPISMTYSVVPALRLHPALAAEWEPRLVSRTYDRRSAPAPTKTGSLAGMAMTEKQGGSDVRANTTRAVADAGGGDGAHRLTGHKFFCSAPMCDLFLMLAYTDAGLSCFAVPRFTPDGAKNAIVVQRLKDKLGNRANASSEIELDGAWGVLVGDEGRGVPTIINMVNHTRLDCAIGAMGVMRQALAQALHHAHHRAAFGRRLVDQPLMLGVLADLAVEMEAATALVLRLARAYDAGDEPQEAAFRRVATAVGKYWICKRQPAFVAEALECLGGSGYVEESILPRLFRESPLNGIWEGSGNVICLDVLRAMVREPEAFAAFASELEAGRGADARYDRALADLEAELAEPAEAELRARRIVERMALLLQAGLLLRHAPSAVADAFLTSRLAGDGGRAFGTLPPSTDRRAVVARAWPLAA